MDSGHISHEAIGAASHDPLDAAPALLTTEISSADHLDIARLALAESVLNPTGDDPSDDNSWQRRAACLGATELFFSDLPEDQVKARQICGSCAVSSECLSYALRTRQRFGIWAGRDSSELKQIILPSVPENLKDHNLDVREVQVDGITAVEKAMDEGQARILFEVYPSGGKTEMAGIIAERWLTMNPDGKVLYLCHTNIGQSRDRFQSLLGDAYTFGTMTGEEKDWEGQQFLFSSFQAMHNRRTQFERDEFGLVIVDESHHSPAATYEPTIDYFTPEFAVAMTGTIERHDAQDITEIWGEPVYSKPFIVAMAERRMAKVHYLVMYSQTESGVLTEHGITVRHLNRNIFVPERDQMLVRKAREEIDTFAAENKVSPKTLIFTDTIDHADRIAAIWPGAQTLHSRNKDTLPWFRETDAATLVTVGMANENTNVPDVNVIVFFNTTDSEPKFIQQLARGLRKIPGKEKCLALDFAGNYERVLMLQKLVDRLNSYRRPTSSSRSQRHVKDTEARVIHLDAGVFEFDARAVDIMERFKFWGDNPPVDYIRQVDFAKEKNRDPRTIMRLAMSLHMVMPFWRREAWLPASYAEELESLPELQIEPARPGEVRLSTTSRNLGIHRNQIKKALKASDIDASVLPVRNFNDGEPPGLALTEDQVKIVHASPYIKALQEKRTATVEPPEEGELSQPKAALALGVSTYVLSRAMEDVGITREDLTSRRIQAKAMPVINPQQLAVIGQSPLIAEGKSAPDGSISVNQMAREYEVRAPKLQSILDELGIKARPSKGTRNHYDMILPEDQPAVRAHPYLNTPKAGKNITSLRMAAKKLKTSLPRISAIIDKTDDINPKPYRFGPHQAQGVTDQEMEILETYLKNSDLKSS